MRIDLSVVYFGVCVYWVVWDLGAHYVYISPDSLVDPANREHVDYNEYLD